MTPRFYAPALRSESGAVELPAEEAEHLTRVLRLGVGATVRVFDGRGLECQARVVHATRRDVRLEVGARVDAAAEPRVRVTLAQAVVKGDKMDGIIRDAVMLGVAAIHPLLTARTDVPESAFATGTRVERWRRIVISSVKQCGRAVVPDLAAPESLEACLRRGHDGLRLMLVEPGILAEVTTGEELRGLSPTDSAQVFVGPEGGWTPAEVSMAQEAGCRLVTLGKRTLRADATPLIALGVLQYLWGDL
ncbi:MAG: 16S rRNA (uracil(1498)-N(3))-methyltransferase [Acidobacteria bacterium]|nr:16S rRNA (uracil(1498)-N(3))-methyltransferase [Acidobacteriota bacterium]